MFMVEVLTPGDENDAAVSGGGGRIAATPDDEPVVAGSGLPGLFGECRLPTFRIFTIPFRTYPALLRVFQEHTPCCHPEAGRPFQAASPSLSPGPP